MNILEVSDFHYTGGASIAASRISKVLHANGNHLTRISSDSPTPGHTLALGRRTSSFLNLLKSLQLTAFLRLIYLKGYIRQMSLILERHNPKFCLFHKIQGAGWPCNENVETNPDCSPCWQNNGCDFNRKCLSDISVEMALKAVEKLISRLDSELELQRVIFN
jgi:hypothetical protein